MAPLAPGDLSGSLEHFGHAASAFFSALSDIGWASLVIGLLLCLVMQILRGHAWTNVLRAAYPGKRISERHIVSAFLIGAGLNGILPARGGDVMKVVLAKRSVEGGTYPTIVSSFAALSPFDSGIGILVLLYAITQGLLPKLPRLPDLPAFDISFWAGHPQLLMLALTILGIGGIALFALLARRAEAFWERVKQGFAVFTPLSRYLREVFAWQLAGWLLRFASFWLFLDAFHIGGSFQNVLLVMSVQAISGALPFTPGGAGAQQALLVATLGGASRAAVLSYSVGQQIAVTAWSMAIAFAALFLVFRITDWRRLVKEGESELGTKKTPEGATSPPG
jgi:glycosyltransferase 2 family protein